MFSTTRQWCWSIAVLVLYILQMIVYALISLLCVFYSHEYFHDPNVFRNYENLGDGFCPFTVTMVKVLLFHNVLYQYLHI